MQRIFSMSNVVEFKKKETFQKPATFWDRFKDMLRNYYSETEVHLIVASILDEDCYNRADDSVKNVANIYYRFAPEK